MKIIKPSQQKSNCEIELTTTTTEILPRLKLKTSTRSLTAYTLKMQCSSNPKSYSSKICLKTPLITKRYLLRKTNDSRLLSDRFTD